MVENTSTVALRAQNLYTPPHHHGSCPLAEWNHTALNMPKPILMNNSPNLDWVTYCNINVWGSKCQVRFWVALYLRQHDVFNSNDLFLILSLSYIENLSSSIFIMGIYFHHSCEITLIKNVVLSEGCELYGDDNEGIL